MIHDMNDVLNELNPSIRKLYSVIHADERCDDLDSAQCLIVTTCVKYRDEIQIHKLLSNICKNPHYIIPNKLIRKIKLIKIDNQKHNQYKPLADLLSKNYIVTEPMYILTGVG